jgi:hypothetical protein
VNGREPSILAYATPTPASARDRRFFSAAILLMAASAACELLGFFGCSRFEGLVAFCLFGFFFAVGTLVLTLRIRVARGKRLLLLISLLDTAICLGLMVWLALAFFMFLENGPR